MSKSNMNLRAVISLIEKSTSSTAGICETGIQGVRLFWTTMSTPSVPLLYEPGLVVLLQGRKHGRLGEQQFIYDADHYLVLTLPMPFECAHEATPSKPLYGLFIDVELEDLALMLAKMAESQPVLPDLEAIALAPAPLGEQMRGAVQHLVNLIDDPLAARVIGPPIRREILFYALRGPRGPALAAVAHQVGDKGRINYLIREIREHLEQPISIEELAGRMGMSVSTFHRAFRRTTGQAPLQYIKRLRLHRAHQMILFEGVKVGEAARQVGYESTSQFSREFKSYFGQNATAIRDKPWTDEETDCIATGRLR